MTPNTSLISFPFDNVTLENNSPITTGKQHSERQFSVNCEHVYYHFRSVLMLKIYGE